MEYFGLCNILSSIRGIFVNDVSRFEKDFALYIGRDYALATSFGRTALYLGLKALGAQGKEVIVPAFTCTVVRQAVILAGATPRFVDLQFGDFAYEMEDLKQKINPLTKAIVVTHLFGRVATNIEEILELGKEKEIHIIEDCAHSFGAEYKGRKVGTYGDFAIFSLTKGLINFGGGVLVTNNKKLYCDTKNILKAEQSKMKRKIADFPQILAYGFEQIIDKLIFDRVRKSIFKWWVIKLPSILLLPRYYFLLLINKLLILIKNRKPQANNSERNIKHQQNPYPVEMAGIIASVAMKQLGEIDQFICRRGEIYNKIKQNTKCFLPYNKDIQSKEVFTNIVFHFKGRNIRRIISYCKDQNLLLRGTWPTHQKLWPEQQTPALEKIRDEILIWNVNPMLTDREINKFIDIIQTVSDEDDNEQANETAV